VSGGPEGTPAPSEKLSGPSRDTARGAPRDVPTDRPPDRALDLPNEIAPHWRRLALAVVVLRFAIPLAAVPAIPFLLRDQIALLVLLRPQKEFLLVGGGQTRYLGEPGVLALLLAYLPLGVLAVTAFFVVGRAYRTALAEESGPAWLHRAVPPEQLELAQRVLARRGPIIAVIGRVAAMPPTVLAAAAGTSAVPAHRYLIADALGSVVGFGLAVGVGLALGQAYEDGGVWLTAVGVLLFTAMIGLVTWWIRREAALDEASADTRA
jgi:membrane protein DedA with SNARE-associated domain